MNLDIILLIAIFKIQKSESLGKTYFWKSVNKIRKVKRASQQTFGTSCFDRALAHVVQTGQ